MRKPRDQVSDSGYIPKNSLEGLVLDKYGLSTEQVQQMNTVRRKNAVFMTVTLKPDYPPCPDCGCDSPHIYRYNEKKIITDLLPGDKSYFIFRQRRYKCPECGRSYQENCPFTFHDMRISQETILLILDELKIHTETFSSVARRHHISPATVMNIFDRFVQIPTHRKLPEVLLIDEVYSFQSEHTGYVCVLLDGRTLEPVDVLPSRRKDVLIQYFSQYSLEERRKVKYFCSDMYDTYQEVAKALFPDAIVAVDRFHVAQLFNKNVQNVRIRIMKGYSPQGGGKKAQSYSLLKNHSDLLTVNSHEKVNSCRNQGKVSIFSQDAAKTWSKTLNKKVSPAELLERITQIHPDLKAVRELTNSFEDLFARYSTSKAAAKPLNRLIARMRESGIEEMMNCAATLVKYRQGILNSYTTTEVYWMVSHHDGRVHRKEKKLTSSLIENRNRIIQIIKNNANGYTNWSRFRNRVLWVLVDNIPLCG